MTDNRKGRTGGNQQALITSLCKFNFTGLTSLIKGLVIILILWGLIPVKFAERLINWVGDDDE